MDTTPCISYYQLETSEHDVLLAIHHDEKTFVEQGG